MVVTMLSDIKINDIVRLNNGGKFCRLVVVLDVLKAHNSIVVAFLHPYTEYATELDVVFPSTVTSVTYDIVVQGDVITTTSLDYVDNIVGSIPVVVPPLSWGWYSDAVAYQPLKPAEIYKGSRLTGVFDVRWQFKVQEGNEARQFTCLAESLFNDNN
jgi:hypothetical protein